MSWLPDILRAVELKPRYFFGTAALGFLLLALPGFASDFFGLTPFMANSKKWVGLGTLAAVVIGIVRSWDGIAARAMQRRRREALVADIRDLSTYDFNALMGCLDKGSRTYAEQGNERQECGVSLFQRGMLEPGETIGGGERRVYVIPAWLWGHMKRNRGLYLTRRQLVILKLGENPSWTDDMISRIRL